MNDSDGAEKIICCSKKEMAVRIIFCLIFPPLAVFDKGCFAVSIVYLLTVIGIAVGFTFGVSTFGLGFFIGWLPAVVSAIFFCCKKDDNDIQSSDDQEVQINPSDILSLLIRYLLCLLFPPLAVVDKGCGSVIAVFFFSLCGWFPGVILALLITIKSKNYYRIKKTAESSE